MSEEDDTRLALIRCALILFGEGGFAGTSTRAIATRCKRPMSAITYHFGSKNGLYLACANHIAETMKGLAGPVADAPLPDNPSGARQQIDLIFSTMTEVMLRHETALFARFILREQQEPTEAFDVIYNGIMGRMLGRLSALVNTVAGDTMSEPESKVHAIALMGKVLAFRVARAAVMKATGWSEIGAEQAAMIRIAIQAQVAAVLDSLERGQEA